MVWCGVAVFFASHILPTVGVIVTSFMRESIMVCTCLRRVFSSLHTRNSEPGRGALRFVCVCIFFLCAACRAALRQWWFTVVYYTLASVLGRVHTASAAAAYGYGFCWINKCQRIFVSCAAVRRCGSLPWHTLTLLVNNTARIYGRVWRQRPGRAGAVAIFAPCHSHYFSLCDDTHTYSHVAHHTCELGVAHYSIVYEQCSLISANYTSVNTTDRLCVYLYTQDYDM